MFNLKQFLLRTFIIIPGIISFVSCDPNEGKNEGTGGILATPELQITRQSQDSFTVAWFPVSNAFGYYYSFNSSESEFTQSTTLTFSDLTPGATYKVEVMAAAPSGSVWQSSPWTELEVTLELSENWFSVTPPYLASDNSSIFEYNAIVVDMYGTDVRNIWYGTFKAGETDGMTEEEIVAALNMGSLSQGYVDQLNTNGYIQGLSVKGLEENTSYVFAAYARHNSGATKLVVTDPVTTKSKPVTAPALAAWCGNYEVKSTSAIRVNVNESGSVSFTLLENSPQTFDITIAERTSGVEYVTIDGWSPYYGTGFMSLATLSSDGASLDFIPTDIGSSASWYPFVSTSQGVSMVSGPSEDPYFTFTKNADGTITSTENKITVGGVSYTVIAADLFTPSGACQHPDGSLIPSGPFTLTKK